MKNILLITSSPRGEASHSKGIAEKLVTKLASLEGETTVKHRDLAIDPIPHIDPSFVHAAFTPPADQTEEQRQRLVLSDTLIDELFWADIIVIGSGMINFGISSTLKSWVDHVSRAGKTFAYGEEGPKPLVHGKKAYIVSSFGGVYSSGPMAAFNHQDPYLRSVLGFFGIHDVETIIVEGVAFGPEALEKALADASEKVASVSAA